MNRKQIIGLVVAAAVFVAVGAANVLTNTIAENILEESVEIILEGGAGFSAPSEDYIGVVRIVGTIEEQETTGLFGEIQSYRHDTLKDYIGSLAEDPNNKGILLYVDSPGGTVYESEEMYLKLKEYKELTGNPVWSYMSHYGASGGYMIPMASDYIYANSNTVTGSIGVIISGLDMTGLYEKLGIRYISITSGENKDSSQMTEEQLDIYQEQVNEYYERFVDIVEEGRGMSEADVKALADGRTYTAKQALENGLIDEISSYEEMQAAMQEELGVYRLYEMDTSTSGLLSALSGVSALIPKSEAQILMEAAEEMESGVPMYYAEQLQ